ncbi:Predicted flavoprotein CzcO associated with the cation diffusion facilitator CzcD [Blastococcus aggregatus]|uniref:Predicted flavoprotein CzcO associated with the cation diffusion facilitator CzcD n=1 Tax=Blastococcus aggregatus TaxID=38502 RepID=A0A285V3H2_9ACTN|nr:NAD(P)/FAD-dependent oxidoreductase [Blastococcus aggregatus]SOC48563.1 Predicted flavoprotein CzcO associated with the cation diffusion facilitator CzcD [Blastococcus aggregatus]
MGVSDTRGAGLAQEIFNAWLTRFGTALNDADAERLSACFLADGFWKDLLAFDWDFRTYSGVDDIRAGFAATLERARPRAARAAPDRSAPRLLKRSGQAVVEGFLDLDTDVGRASCFVRLLVDAADPPASRAWIALTALPGIRGFEEQIGERRPTGHRHTAHVPGDNWLDERLRTQRYEDRDPQVLIVGGGHAGLSLAARLGQMGVDALIVERNARIGDNWRDRYHSLTLHNEVWANSLPYLPFPATWPTFLPKDKLAGWLAAYAEFMELNVWTDTELLNGAYDESTGKWTAHLRTGDQPERVVRVPHIVMATGSVSGLPRLPAMTGLDSFTGDVLHSSHFTDGASYAGKRAVVVGTGNSGHDVAQDLHSHGAEVTMVQRSPTCVISLVPSGTMVYALYSEGPPIEDVDLITAAIPYPVLKSSYQWLTKRTRELDGELLNGLHAVGFETDFEPDGTGFHMRYLRTGGGYYINVGCSELIARREVGLVQARDIDRFTSAGLRLADGTGIPCDVVVLATGYENQQQGLRRLFGDDVADRVGPIWGFDENHFMRNMWRRTAQRGLWIMGGAMNESRLWSRFLALQIRADLSGLLPSLRTNATRDADVLSDSAARGK